MKLKITLALCLFFLTTSLLRSQNATIRGAVFDDGNGETLPGVTILLEGTTTGTMSDFDGEFNLSVPPGTHTLRFSFISYETLYVREIVVKAGSVSFLDNLRMKEARIQLSEVVVTAEALRNSEAALLTMKQKSANVIDGISSANFRKIGDSDAASSMKRVTGVSVEGGKYVFVRGLGDRYTKTILNGMDIPGLDPDRNTLQMDIFPTQIIDNIVVMKSFTANLPADFTGGVIDIATKDFPETRSISLSVSASYNPGMHFNDDYLSYEGGKTDFLGFDDGTRAIPATENIPLFSEVIANPDGPQGQRYQQILSSFNPTLAAMKQRSFMDYSLGFSVGNQINRPKATWGYNMALSYQNKTAFYQNTEYGRYGLSGDPAVTQMDTREHRLGDYGSNSVLLGGIAGIALKKEHAKYRLNFMHLQNGESTAGVFSFTNNDQGAYFEGIQHNLEYSERSLTNLLISGKHFWAGQTWNLEWKVSPSHSAINDPDIRFTRYEIRDGQYKIGTESGFPERIWRSLSENDIASGIQAEKEMQVKGRKAKLNFGLSATIRMRDYVIRNFQVNVRNIPLTGDPNEIFAPENLWPYQGSISRGTTFETPFMPVNPNQYQADNRNTGAFASFEWSPFSRLKAILGLRSEWFVQHYTGQDQLGTNILDHAVVLDDLGFFPSANLIYTVNEHQNLRVNYAKTVARPSFKELSYAEIFDPVSGRVFIGGLFRDANDVSGIVYWDGNLQSTNIQNIDLRWESFGTAGQTLSAGAFYKYFSKPIEFVQYATQTGAFQPRNVGDAKVIGLELEVRQKLDPLGAILQKFVFSSNITWTYSQIKLSKTEYDSRVANARTGQTISEYRSMAGQSPFIVNAGLGYEGGESGILKQLEAGLYYNVQGKTLEMAGIVDRPDIFTKAFHSLNFNLNQSFGKDKRYKIGVKVENILNQKRESVYSSYKADDQLYTRIQQGTSFHVRLGIQW